MWIASPGQNAITRKGDGGSFGDMEDTWSAGDQVTREWGQVEGRDSIQVIMVAASAGDVRGNFS
jgi:hypothetical protein